MSDDLAYKLCLLARLMENKAPVTFQEQDAAQLRKAADEIAHLRSALKEILQTREEERNDTKCLMQVLWIANAVLNMPA